MRGRHGLVAVALLAGALGAAPVLAGEGWVEVRSPSFTVVSDGSEKDARKVVLQFEQVRALLQEVWPWARLDTVRPLTILAARDEGALRALLPAFWEKKGAFHPAGIFVSAPDRSWGIKRSISFASCTLPLVTPAVCTSPLMASTPTCAFMPKYH